MRIRAIILLAALVAPALAVAAHADPVLNSEDVTTKVTGRVTELRVDGDISNVRLTPGTASSVTAHLEWTFDKPTVTVTVNHGVVTVKARCNDGVDGGVVRVGLISTCVDDLRIVVPAAATLVVDTGADVTATRFTGPVDLRGAAIDVSDLRTPRLRISGRAGATVRRVRAPFAQIAMSSGSINADHLQGRSLTLSSGSGSIRATDVVAGTLNVSDSSGNVSLSRVNADAVAVSTGNGTVDITDVRAPRATFASSSGNVYTQRVTTDRLDVSTGNGTISVSDVIGARTIATSRSGNVTIQRLRGNRLEASSGNGTLTVADVHLRNISAHTSSGNLSVQDLDAPDVLVANSGNGTVNVRVPTGRYYVDARSNNGTVHVTGLTLDRRAIREITAISSSGNVSVTGV